MVEEKKNNLLKNKEIGLFYNPWKFTSEHKKSVSDLYRRAVLYKANPRSEKYMRNLFAEYSPEGTFINIQSDSDWQSKLSSADSIILLYPDSIGINFSSIESKVNSSKQKWTGVKVLNGRRRAFVLNHSVRLQLRLRRFIEQTMIGEAVFTVWFDHPATMSGST